MELTPRQIKICDLIDMIDSSMDWSLTDEEKDKKIIVYSIGLKGIPDELIDIGLSKQLMLNVKTFPTPGQFRQLCKPAKKLTNLTCIGWEDSTRDKELNKKIYTDLLRRCGVKLLKNGKVEKINKDVEREKSKLNRMVKNLRNRVEENTG